jgi:aconitate hydratase
LKAGDDISTDEILPAGAKVLHFRSNIQEISRFVFSPVDETYSERAIGYQKQGSFIVGGSNYGLGSSREHAALAPAIWESRQSSQKALPEYICRT